MKNRILSLILVFCITAALIPAFLMNVSAASSGTLGGKLKWVLDSNGTLTISGTGDMPSWTANQIRECPWYLSRASIKSLVIKKGVTSIGMRNFFYCTELEKVTISNTVRCIEVGAFLHCRKLKSITIPSSVTSVGNSAFNDCSKLSDVYYTGIKKAWRNISFGTGNECLTNAIIHYNQVESSNDQYISESPVYSSDDEKILDSLGADIEDIFSEISFGEHKIKGPYLNIFGKHVYLYEIDAELTFNIGGNIPVSAVVDKDTKTLKIMIGYEEKTENDNNTWSSTYENIKDAYVAISGNKVNTNEMWRKFSNIRGKLKKFDAKLLVDAECRVGGFFEVGYESGKITPLGGGAFFGVEVSGGINMHMPPPFSVVYVGMELSVGANGAIQIDYRNKEFSYYLHADPSLNLSLILMGVGVDLGAVEAYVEGGISGKLKAEIAAANGIYSHLVSDPLKVYLSGYLFIKGTAFGFINAKYEWDLGEEKQLYPKNNVMLNSLDIEELGVENLIDEPVPIPRDYLNRAILASDNQFDKIYSDTAVYPFSSPKITRLSNGDLFFVRTDDLGTKNNVNKTSLMYSIYDGKAWSDEESIFENGTYNGSAFVYNDGEKVHIVWRKAKTVFGDDASLNELAEDTEIFYTSSQDGVFTDPVQITDNDSAELAYSVFSNKGKTVVAWVEKADGVYKVYTLKQENGVWSEKTLIGEETNVISAVYPYYKNGTVQCAYTVVDEIGISRLHVDNEIVIVGSSFTYDNGKIYYLSDNRILYYDVENELFGDTGLKGVNNFSVNGNNFYTLVYENFKSELYECINENGVFSEWKQVTDFGEYIREYSVATDNTGEPIYAVNIVDVIAGGGELYGDSELAVCKATDVNALAVSSVNYDEAKVGPSEVLPLNIDVYNLGTTDINNLNVSITNNKGDVLSSGIVYTEIVAGASAEVVYNYILPDELSLHDITVTVTNGENERDIENNSIKTSIGYADALVTGVVIERTDSGAVAKGTVYNEGFSVINNAVLSVYDASRPDEVLDTIECGTIASDETWEFTYDIPEEYLTIEDKMTMHGLIFKVECDEPEMNYANNSQKVVFGELTDYTVTFVDGNYLMDIVSVDEFDNYSISKDGYTFEGWYTSSFFDVDSKITAIPTNISDDLTLFAKWIPMVLNKAEYADESINISATVAEELISAGSAIILAIYQNDNLVSVHSIDATSNVDYCFDNIAQADDYSIKMFCWNIQDNLNPLCETICAEVK